MKKEFLPFLKQMLEMCFGETCNLIIMPSEMTGEFMGYTKSTPSHREKLLEICSDIKGTTPEEILATYDRTVTRMDLIEYLCDMCDCVAVYEHHSVGNCNTIQRMMLKDLIDCGYYNPYHKEV